MATSVYFNGEQITVPGAYSAIDVTGMSTKGDSEGAKIIGLIGECTGGEPASVQFFNDPVAAKKVLKSGELLKACEKAWNPVSKTKDGVLLGGANMIACIRSNRATKSVYEITQEDELRFESTLAEFPTQKTQYLGKPVSDFVEDGAKVLEDGTVLGVFKWVTGFTAFNETIAAEQNGYYVPIKLTSNVTGTKMTLKKDGQAREDKTEMDFDPELLFRVTSVNDKFTVEVDGKEIITFNFEQAQLGTDNVADHKPQLRFESKDWGENTAHQIKIQNGSLSRTKKLVIYDQTTGGYETFDNLGNLFTVNYTGEEKYAELNIFKDTITEVMWFQTKIGEDAATAVEDIKIKLDKNVLKSIKALIQQIQSYENYVVNASNKYNARLVVTDLDYVRGQNIKAEQGSVSYRVTATYADIASELRINSQLVELAQYDKSQGEIQNFDYVTMEGGTAGVSPASWVEYFDMLSNFDVTYIVPLVGDVAIHAELNSHINTLSGNMGKERRGVVGGNNYETVAETLERARDLASDRIQVVHGGFYDYNSNAELELYPPYILAAQHAGRAAFLEDGESATHDTYRMTAPEYKLERAEITQLLEGGCLAFEFILGKNSTAQSSVRLVQDLTTDVTSTDTVHTERATGALADSINKEMRDKLDNLLTGKRVGPTDMTSASNVVISVLKERERKEQIIAWKDVYVTKKGTVTTIDYSLAPSEPNNFTLITGHYYSETLTADTSNEE